MNLLRYFLLKFSKFSKRFSFIIQIFFSISFRILTHLCISRAPHLPFSLWLRSRRIFFHTIFIKIFIDTISFDRSNFSFSLHFLSRSKRIFFDISSPRQKLLEYRNYARSKSYSSNRTSDKFRKTGSPIFPVSLYFFNSW